MDGGGANSAAPCAEFCGGGGRGAGCLTNILQTKVWRKVGRVLVLTSLKGYSVFTRVTGRGAMTTNTERKPRPRLLVTLVSISGSPDHAC